MVVLPETQRVANIWPCSNATAAGPSSTRTATIVPTTEVPCRCACGTEREVPKYKLTQGRSKSCGCLKSERLRGLTPPNLAPECDREVRVGSRHGRWTALTEPYSDPAYANRVALCRCDCGVTAEPPGQLVPQRGTLKTGGSEPRISDSRAPVQSCDRNAIIAL